MQAEFNAKLAEKDLEIKSKKMELEQQRIAKMEERYTWVGIGLITTGILLGILAPLPVLKKGGFAMVVAGIIVSSFPFIGNEPWFKYAIGGLVGLIVLVGIIMSFVRKVDNDSTNINQDKS